ncbi:hypothetical protein RCL_jg4183.t1 [Rhizophagus clarus]|uniref:Uncharacterized protein n=1 Tax=Rhizophagus clarus TaxID=94130 RepID=A0A8H3QCC9_9GLOM|nr:hypothetical protein RCL_jg4183.t1 [Rhizophagus clarus]
MKIFFFILFNPVKKNQLLYYNFIQTSLWTTFLVIIIYRTDVVLVTQLEEEEISCRFQELTTVKVDK